MGGCFGCLQGGYDDTEEHDPSSAENLVESSTGDQYPPQQQQEHAGGAPAAANSLCRNICDSFKKCICSNWCIGGSLEDGFLDDGFPDVMYYPMIVPLPLLHSPPPARETGANENRVAGTESDESEEVVELGYDGKEVAKTGIEPDGSQKTEADESEKIVKLGYDGKEVAETGVDGYVIAGTEADGSDKIVELGYDEKEVAETGVDGYVIAGTETDGSEKIVELGYDGKEVAETGVDRNVVAGTETDGSEKIVELGYDGKEVAETGVDGNIIAGTEADGSEKLVEIGYDGKEVAETEVDGNVDAGTETDGGRISPPLLQSTPVREDKDLIQNNDTRMPDTAGEDETSLQEKSPNARTLIDFTRETAQDVSALNSNVRTGDEDKVAGTEADGSRISPPLLLLTPARESEDLIQNNDTRMPDMAGESGTSLQDISALNSDDKPDGTEDDGFIKIGNDAKEAAEIGVDGSEIAPPLLQWTPARESEDLIQNNDTGMPDTAGENGTSLQESSALNSDVRSGISEYEPDGTEDDEFIKIVKIGYDAREAAETEADGSEISPLLLQSTPARESEDLIQNNNMRNPDTAGENGTSLQDISALNSDVRIEISEYEPDGTEDDEFIKIVKFGYDAREAAEHWD